MANILFLGIVNAPTFTIRVVRAPLALMRGEPS